MKIRKQVYDLTVEDLARHPVWQFALDEEGEEGQDEATVRPYDYTGVLSPADGMFVVRAKYILADGSPMQGYLTPQSPGNARPGRVQPMIITSGGQVGFWYGMLKPSVEELAKNYRLLGLDAMRTFPIQYNSAVELKGGPMQGMIYGFMVLDDLSSGNYTTLI